MVAARAYGVHPAIWAGRPDLIGCHAWTVWTMRLLHAEDEVRRQPT